MRKLQAILATLGAAIIISGCASEKTAPAPCYSVNIVQGCAPDLEHPTYDPTLPGFWLVGRQGTIQVSRVEGCRRPEAFVFMLRTRPDTTEKSPTRIDQLTLLTAKYRVLTRFNPEKTAPVIILAYNEKKQGTEVIPVETDITGKFIQLQSVGDRVKITLTGKALELIGEDIALSWKEDLKASEAEVQAAEERSRRIL